MFKLTSTAFIDKKWSESTKLSLFRNEKVNDRQIDDSTILRKNSERKVKIDRWNVSNYQIRVCIKKGLSY